MRIDVGESIGPYQITKYIGQGGMATIYKARQVNLDRDVALKIIHPALKDDQSFLARLQREASIVASLNHPNIVPVYDSGQCDGIPYLVMQFIDGKTLKAAMAEKNLSTVDILRITRGVADALTFAHSHGILHRDVKPSNIMIDRDGHIYLTDFGLARLTYSGESTLSRDMLIGSPQYLSPEQAKGEHVDERSDIYSLGIVLYEMFTGRVPFQGETPYATIMSHINDPLPAPRALNPRISPAVEIVLEKALAKDREERYASAHELMTALENAARGPMASDDNAVPIVLNPFPKDDAPTPHKRPLPTPAPTPHKRSTSTPSPTPYKRSVPPPPPPPSQHVAPRVPNARVMGGIGALVLVCIVAACVAVWGVFRLPLPFVGGLLTNPTVPSIAPLTTPTRSVRSPIVGPSPTQGIPPTNTTRPTTAISAADTPRGKIAYSIASDSLPEHHNIWIANGSGGEARLIVETAIMPALSPDGRQIAYYRMKDSGIYIANSNGTSPRKIIPYSDTCCVQWSPDGKNIVYFRGNLKIGGSIFIAGSDGSNITEIAQGFNPAWSPDGNRLTYTACLPNTFSCGIFILDIKTRRQTQITKDNGANPQWSPQGDRVVYQADDGKGHVNVFAINIDGTGFKQLTNGRGNDGQPVYSRDGNFVFWRSDQNGAGWAVFAMHPDGTSPRLVVKDTPVSDQWGRESLSTAP